MPDYGNRINGTPKGNGFFGPLKRPDGDISTELSFGFNHGGKEYLAPLLTPNLKRSEIDHLLSGKDPTDEIYNKAISHALERQKAGLDMFATPNEIVPLPNYSLEEITK